MPLLTIQEVALENEGEKMEHPPYNVNYFLRLSGVQITIDINQ